jgi:hypothetical protein
LEAQFRTIFIHVPQQYLNEAVSKQLGWPSEQRVDLGLDHRWLLHHCPHYARYGSEYIQNLASMIRTPDGCNHKEHLKTVGTPVLVTVEIPIDQIDHERGELDEMLEALAEERYTEVFQADGMIDHGISIGRDVPAEWIMDICLVAED